MLITDMRKPLDRIYIKYYGKKDPSEIVKAMKNLYKSLEKQVSVFLRVVVLHIYDSIINCIDLFLTL